MRTYFYWIKTIFKVLGLFLSWICGKNDDKTINSLIWFRKTHVTWYSPDDLLYLFVIQKNIVHRDLKLGNMVLNKRSRRITITNFCLGKHLVSENDLLLDQRGSPAYISPDVLSGETVGICGVISKKYICNRLVDSKNYLQI